MQILVLGSTGPVGRAIVARAKAAGVARIVGVSRTGAAIHPGEDEHLLADRTDPAEMAEALRVSAADTVIDVIAYSEASTAPLLAALDGRIARYVMIGSSDVYRNYGLLHGREDGTPEASLTEDSPLRESRYPYRGDKPRADNDPQKIFDDYDKIPIEDAVRQMRSDWTILRLPMIYGPGDPLNRFAWALKPMLTGQSELEVPRGWANWIATYSFMTNTAAAILHAAGHPAAARRIFNVGEEAPLPHLEWIERMRWATGWTGKVRLTDDPESPFEKALGGIDFSVPLSVSSWRFFSDLEFRPPIGLEQALLETVDATRASL